MTRTQTPKPGGTAAQFLTALHMQQADLWFEGLQGYDDDFAAALRSRYLRASEGGYVTIDFDLGLFVMTVKGREYVDSVEPEQEEEYVSTCNDLRRRRSRLPRRWPVPPGGSWLRHRTASGAEMHATDPNDILDAARPPKPDFPTHLNCPRCGKATFAGDVMHRFQFKRIHQVCLDAWIVEQRGMFAVTQIMACWNEE